MNFCLETMIHSIFDMQKKKKIQCKWGINILVMNLAVERGSFPSAQDLDVQSASQVLQESGVSQLVPV